MLELKGSVSGLGVHIQRHRSRDGRNMIPVEEALEIVLASVEPLEGQEVEILDALDRVLDEDVVSQEDIPPFDNSAMDGYAVRASDLRGASGNSPIILDVIEDLQAGYVARNSVSEGRAIRIMTGAPMPSGADSVVMVEYTKTSDDKVEVFQEVSPGENVRRAGEDVAKGAKVLSKDDPLGPAEIGLLASLGKARVRVIRPARVAILATGDELLTLDEPIEPGKIRSSNTYTLVSQCKRCKAVPMNLGIAKDTKEDVASKLEEARAADVIVTSAGVSVGDYDIVKDVLEELGTRFEFWKVAMKPGMPTAFGLMEGKPVFGLPGNPVSSMVTFELFVRPAVLKMMGRKRLKRPVVSAVLEEEVQKKPGRVNFVRAWVTCVDGVYHASTTGPQGSGILRSMSLANGLIVVPKDTTLLNKGEEVSVQLLDQPEV